MVIFFQGNFKFDNKLLFVLLTLFDVCSTDTADAEREHTHVLLCLPLPRGFEQRHVCRSFWN